MPLVFVATVKLKNQKVQNMVESTKANPHLLMGQYANTGTRPRARDKNILLVSAAQPLDALCPDWVQRSQLNKTEYQPFDAVRTLINSDTT